MHASFFEPVAPGTFLASDATAGPWSPDAQHGGPPSALAAREIEQHEPDEGMRLARVAVDILRPVPLGVLTVKTRTLRPGKRVALIEAVLEADGQEVLCARGWRIARSDDAPVITRSGGVPEVPSERVTEAFAGAYMGGYLAQIDWRFVSGNFTKPGPCQAWGRPRLPLLPDEELTPMCRALLLADSGSGVSMAVDPLRYMSINVDLTVVLHRDPAGEWLMLDGLTTMGGSGTGLAETLLWDADGVVGADLRQQVRAQPGLTVLTGGQTGVDTYAAIAALRAGLSVHLVFPCGCRQEDGSLTAARRRRLRGAVLHELQSDSFRDRTWACVRLADVVLLLDPAGGTGCLETARAAGRLGTPLWSPEPGQVSAARTRAWLHENNVQVIMVAGCRASVLASAGNGRGLPAQLAAIMRGARQYHEDVVGAGFRAGSS